MKSVLASLRNLILPWGATSGRRIVLDGDAGTITAYDENSDEVINLDDTGITVTDPATQSYVALSPTGGGALVDLKPGPAPAVVGSRYEGGLIQAYGNSAPDYRPGLQIWSPAYDPPGGASYPVAQINMKGGGATAATDLSEVNVIADLIDFTPTGSSGEGQIRARDRELTTAPLGCFFSVAGTIVSCPAVSGAETALPAWNASSDADVTMKPGRMVRINIDVGIYHADTSGAMAQVRVRRGVNTVAGTQLGFFRFLLGAEGSNVPGPFHGECYVKNDDLVFDTSFTPGLTIARVIGSAVTHSLYGDASIPCRIVVEDMGLAADNPALAATAVGII